MGMKIMLFLTLGFASLANAQDSTDIPVEVQENQIPDVTIRVKQGCHLTGWQNASKDAYKFFVSCGNKKDAITIHGLGKLDNVIISTVEQEKPVSVQPSTTYGIDWNKVNQER